MADTSAVCGSFAPCQERWPGLVLCAEACGNVRLDAGAQSSYASFTTQRTSGFCPAAREAAWCGGGSARLQSNAVLADSPSGSDAPWKAGSEPTPCRAARIVPDCASGRATDLDRRPPGGKSRNAPGRSPCLTCSAWKSSAGSTPASGPPRRTYPPRFPDDAEVVRTVFLHLDRTDALGPPAQGMPTVAKGALLPPECDPGASSLHREFSQATIDVHPPAPAAPAPPPRPWAYPVIGFLGKGGFGTVFLGYDSQLQHRVAIKVPRGTSPAPPRRPSSSSPKHAAWPG